MKKSLGETLCALRKGAGLTQPQVSERLAELGVDIQCAGISKWEKGQTQPSASQFLALCGVYGVADVLAEFTDIPTPMSRLNAQGRSRVSDYIRVLDLSGLYANPPQRSRVLPLYSIPASAGTGQFLDGEDFDMAPVDDRVPESADFGVRISGDSMEPMIPDGSVVWVRRSETPRSGRVGVFDYDGRAYCKKLVRDEKGAYLVSINPKYPPIQTAPGALLRAFGEVVAVTSPE